MINYSTNIKNENGEQFLDGELKTEVDMNNDIEVRPYVFTADIFNANLI